MFSLLGKIQATYLLNWDEMQSTFLLHHVVWTVVYFDNENFVVVVYSHSLDSHTSHATKNSCGNNSSKLCAQSLPQRSTEVRAAYTFFSWAGLGGGGVLEVVRLAW